MLYRLVYNVLSHFNEIILACAYLISFPEILVGAISWVLFCNFAVSPLVQNKSVLNKNNENLALVLYSILTYLVLKGADTAKLQNRTQEIAIHLDKKKWI